MLVSPWHQEFNRGEDSPTERKALKTEGCCTRVFPVFALRSVYYLINIGRYENNVETLVSWFHFSRLNQSFFYTCSPFLAVGCDSAKCKWQYRNMFSFQKVFASLVAQVLLPIHLPLTKMVKELDWKIIEVLPAGEQWLQNSRNIDISNDFEFTIKKITINYFGLTYVLLMEHEANKTGRFLWV